MARRKENSFPEFARLIYQWRVERFKTARAFYEYAGLKCSYTTYSDFERGALMPGINDFLLIAKAAKIDPFEASLYWSMYQMPGHELRTRFKEVLKMVQHRTERGEKLEPVSPGVIDDPDSVPGLDNTWVFGPREHEMLTHYPWVIDVLFALSIYHPSAIPIGRLPLPQNVSAAELLGPVLGHAIAAKMIAVENESNLKLILPFFYLPRTPMWSEVRNNNSRIAFQAMLPETTIEKQRNGAAFRELTIRSLGREQAFAMVNKLRQVADHFRTLPHYPEESDSAKDPSYGCLIVFGPRRLLKK